MIVTEEEARTKLCQERFAQTPDGLVCHAPLTTVSVSGSGGFATYAIPMRNCLASECMAWCWFDNRADQAIKEPRGYCGKAGHGNE